ncbi:hypothetical protein B0H13DRAFT_1916482 [Mycena leptocephala]|nr:hypothetical protein B0H13DRAFT_1916482 [Mycena leptocephala]
MSEEVPPAIFEEATRISPNKIKAYRKSVGVSGGPQCYYLDYLARVPTLPCHDDSEVCPTSWNAEDVSMDELRAYRTYMVNNKYHGNGFFSLENTDAWISPVTFQDYMASIYRTFEEYRSKNSTPFSSRAPSRAASSMSYSHSRASSRASFTPSSQAGSPDSFAETRSRPPSAMSIDDSFHVPDSDDSAKPNEEPNMPKLTAESAPPTSLSMPINSKAQAAQSKRKRTLTRELGVDEIVELDSVPSTFTVPERPIANLFDLTKSKELLTVPNGKVLSLDAYIRSEVNSSEFGLSQALPRLPPPPTSPSYTELEETDVNSAATPELSIVPQDIDLEFNERNWLENGDAHSPAALQTQNYLRGQRRKYRIGGGVVHGRAWIDHKGIQLLEI